MPEKCLLKYDLFPKFKTKIFIFEYFPKMPSEMNSLHPFYPIWIPNTSYVKFLFCFQKLKKKIMISKN